MPEPGILYCLGIGPGDPELVTVKAARLLGTARHVVAPVARIKADSLALAIARPHLHPAAQVHERVFPMTSDRAELVARWDEAAAFVDGLLLAGDDVCFPTLGDPLLYSTALYLVRALRNRRPGARAEFVPGVTAFSCVAAIVQKPVGEGKRPVVIVPAADEDPDAVRRALACGGTVVVMKIGKRLPAVLDLLAEAGALERAAMVSRAGQEDQRVYLDLAALRGTDTDAGYLAVIIVPAPEAP